MRIPVAGRYNQTAGNRPSQDHVTDNHIRSTGGTVLLSHRWRHSQHREKNQNPGQAAIVATRTRGGTRSCDEASPLELGQAASRQPTTTHPRLTTGAARACSTLQLTGKSTASKLAEKPYVGARVAATAANSHRTRRPTKACASLSRWASKLQRRLSIHAQGAHCRDSWHNSLTPDGQISYETQARFQHFSPIHTRCDFVFRSTIILISEFVKHTFTDDE